MKNIPLLLFISVAPTLNPPRHARISFFEAYGGIWGHKAKGPGVQTEINKVIAANLLYVGVPMNKNTNRRIRADEYNQLEGIVSVLLQDRPYQRRPATCH